MRPFIVLITQYYHLDTKDPNFKLLERFTVSFHDKTSNGTSLNEARKENVQQEEQDPGEYTTHTGKCSNPTLLIFSTRKITDMKIQAPSSLTFYSFASYFMIPFIFHVRAVPIKLFVCIIGVLATIRFQSNLPKQYLVRKPAQSVQMVPSPDGWGW